MNFASQSRVTSLRQFSKSGNIQHQKMLQCARVVMSELSDAESTGDGYDHTTLQESATDSLSFSSNPA
ncbi:hypothetical protein ATANTOWER_002767 [Ataeniobius toweri]|uniref:Uncharacterized protein n=1 Tax=Ataeniobius toweri TaxID=208326 RepID=A0ABU7AEY9_9TELE|nr:hypothetical protein [Ataeniobius toweri]